MKILVTGAAGFIGSHVALSLLERGDEVVGFDNLNDHYDVDLKRARLARLQTHERYRHVHGDIADRAAVEFLFASQGPQRVIHLAAQAGVHYGARDPHLCLSSNVTGFLHVLEGCRHHRVEHLVYASTSSVYGANPRMPLSERDSTDYPLTLYAASKKANESMAHSYASLFDLPCTGLRFFTVYGPWGRPDMALFLFTRAILADEPIRAFNYGQHHHSFTYIDDVVAGVIRACDEPARGRAHGDDPQPDRATGAAPYRILNLGNHQMVSLLHYIDVLEQSLGKQARRELLPLQPGDIPDTEADMSEFSARFGPLPQVPVEEGIPKFVAWYREYYQV